jgi:hypothetical protein
LLAKTASGGGGTGRETNSPRGQRRDREKGREATGRGDQGTQGEVEERRRGHQSWRRWSTGTVGDEQRPTERERERESVAAGWDF